MPRPTFPRSPSTPYGVHTHTQTSRTTTEAATIDSCIDYSDDYLLSAKNEPSLTECYEPIAIVGMGCRYPGDSSSPAKFWDLLRNGRSGQNPRVPASRFNIDAYHHSNPDRPGSFRPLGGYFINEDLAIDPTFFNITPVEAMWMDPQQRKVLEVVYECFENAGITLEAVSGSDTATYVGCFTNDFQKIVNNEADYRHNYAATGTDPGLLSARVSYVFNLKGPCLTMNTACSSSIYALHQACNALRMGDCKAALVGGTNLIITPAQHMDTAKLGVLSPSSTCHTFDERANGYGRGEGVGAVYLKRLSDAVKDGDPIRAVIRGSAVNSNGKAATAGITHPSFNGQESVIRAAYRMAGGIDPNLTGYFECHGTGTPIGDPLEVRAMKTAMKTESRPSDRPLLIGAVKTNVGHSEAASGLAALMKAVFALEKKIIPPTIGLQTPNPKILFNEWNVSVPTKCTPWPAYYPIRRAGVNSFGYGGTNAHCILEATESVVPGYVGHKTLEDSARPASKALTSSTSRGRTKFLCVWSAHDSVTLKKNVGAYGREVIGKVSLLDVSYTLGVRRSRFSNRAFVVLDQVLDQGLEDGMVCYGAKKVGKTPALGFIFTGQGAQWAGMGKELMDSFPSFERTIRELDCVISGLDDDEKPTFTLESMIRGTDNAEKRIDHPSISQPICTAVQIALVRLLHSWNIRPVVTVGHSSGEIAAAYAAGHISAHQAILIAYYRGLLIGRDTQVGAMMAVGLGPDQAQKYVKEGEIVVACVNSPESVTLSGEVEAIDRLAKRLTDEKIFARKLRTGGRAYHSHQMKAIAHAYSTKLDRILGEPISNPPNKATMISSVVEEVVRQEDVFCGEYWTRNLTSTVCFSQAVSKIPTISSLRDSVTHIIEIGPHSVLKGPFRQIAKANIGTGLENLTYIPSLLRNEDSVDSVLELVGNLFVAEYPLDMQKVNSIESINEDIVEYTTGKLLVDLPAYQWDYAKFQAAEPRPSAEARASGYLRHDILGRLIFGGTSNEPQWRNFLRLSDLPWLEHHKLGEDVIFPGAGYWAMAVEAMTQYMEQHYPNHKTDGYTLRDVDIKAALAIPDDDNGIETIFSLRPVITGEVLSSAVSPWYEFKVTSIYGGRFTDHCIGKISTNFQNCTLKPLGPLKKQHSGSYWYAGIAKTGLDYGSSFQGMEIVRTNPEYHQAACATTFKTECGLVQEESRYAIHPATVDTCLQLVLIAAHAGVLKSMAYGFVPLRIDEISLRNTAGNSGPRPAEARAWVYGKNRQTFLSETQLVSGDEVLLDVVGMRYTSYEAALPQAMLNPPTSLPYMNLVWKPDVQDLTSFEARNYLAGLDAIGKLITMVDLMCHKNSGLRILEAGAGDGQITEDILQTIGGTGLKIRRFAEYCIMDSDAENIEILEKRFDGVSKVFVKQLDQFEGVKNADYDLVLAPQGIKDQESLTTIRRLAKVNGHLLVRADVSSLDFSAAGFSRPQISIDVSGSTEAICLCTAKAVETLGNGFVHYPVESTLYMVYRTMHESLLDSVAQYAEENSWNFVLVPLSDCASIIPEGAKAILFDEKSEESILSTISHDEWEALRHIIQASSSIVWVTFGGLLEARNPTHAMANGFARALTSEQAALKLVTLDFDPLVPEERISEIILDKVQSAGTKSSGAETEYIIGSDGIVYVGRLDSCEAKNAEAEEIEPVLVPFVGQRLKGVLKPKPSSTVVFTEVEEDELADDEVEIRVAAIGLNPEDAHVFSESDNNRPASQECSGIITRLGKNVPGLKIGNRVVAFSFDTFSTYQKVPATMVQRLPGDLSFQKAATLPVVYATALHAIEDLGRLDEGDMIFIHATGPAAVAAVTVACLKGAEVFISSTSQDEARYMEREFSIAKDHIIEINRSEILAGNSTAGLIRKLTHGRGFDVVFSTYPSTENWARESWRTLAAHGRYVEVGKHESFDSLDTTPFKRGAQRSTLDLTTLPQKKLGSLLKRVMASYGVGEFSAISRRRDFTVENIDTALRESLNSLGKVVVTYRNTKEHKIKILPSKRELKFSPDASYLLVGCLGGLGRSLTTWMIGKGAKRLVFLSRSGSEAPEAKALVGDLRNEGVSVQVIRGDVSIKRDVARALAEIDPQYPLRGVVHAAMILKDGFYENMSLDNYRAAITPKVVGAQNLHDALLETSADLDFFVMTSSISGMLGNSGQANYAAGNVFMDFLAKKRRAMGLPATSLVLPMVLGVGYVADKPELEKNLTSKGLYGIDEDELLSSFEAAMQYPQGESDPEHIVVGMDPTRLSTALSNNPDLDSYWVTDVRLAHVKAAASESSVGTLSTSGAGIIERIKSAATYHEAVDAVQGHVVNKLSRLLLVPMEEFEGERLVGDYGLDSMIGTELRNWVFKEFASDVPYQQLVGPLLTVRKLAEMLCGKHRAQG